MFSYITVHENNVFTQQLLEDLYTRDSMWIGANRNVCSKMLWMREEKSKLPKDTGKVGDFVYITEALDVSSNEVRHRNCI